MSVLTSIRNKAFPKHVIPNNLYTFQFEISEANKFEVELKMEYQIPHDNLFQSSLQPKIQEIYRLKSRLERNPHTVPIVEEKIAVNEIFDYYQDIYRIKFD